MQGGMRRAFGQKIGDRKGVVVRREPKEVQIDSESCLVKTRLACARASDGGPVAYPRRATVLPAFHGTRVFF